MSSNAVSLKRLAAVMPSNIDKHSVEDERPVSLCNYVDVYKNERITDAIDFMEATATDAQIARFTLQAHDVLVTKDSEEPTDIGIPAYVPEAIPGVVCGYHLAVIRPEPGRLHGAYLHWALQSAEVQTYYATTATGISRYALGIQDLGMTPIHLPSLTDQERIANFLDEKTARIDALIAEKERLVERLEEFLTSELERSFTGSNANERSWKTGNLFFPDLPMGWRASALKHVLSSPVTDGPHETPDLVTEGVPFISAEAVKGGRVDFDRKRGYITEDLHALYCQKVKPRRDDIFMVKSGNTTGAVAIVETDDEFSVWSPLAVLRADSTTVLARFLYLAMQAPYFQRSVQLFWSQGTQPNIGMAVLENLQIAVPSICEQAKIVKRVGNLRERIDVLTQHCQAHIERLREYRSSLISAAVTGQMNIDDFQARQLNAS